MKAVELLAKAWNRWGVETPDRLRGSFAFAIHDRKCGKVFLARDVFGLSPLYYALTDDALCVGRSSRSVRAATGANFHPDELMLSDFVAGASIERQRTFFEGVRRLPPAHVMTVGSTSSRSIRYWSVQSIEPDSDPVDPVGRFRAMFDRSVDRCLDPGETTLMLSGGLDSSAIAGSWADAHRDDRLPALALTYRHSPGWCDDTHLAQVAQASRINLVELPGDGHDPLADMPFWLKAVDGLYLPYGHSVSFQLLHLARKTGSRVVLSGHGGDEVVSYGFGRLNELAKAGQWFRLWREVRASAGLYNESRWSLFQRYLSHVDLWRRLRRRFSTGTTPGAPVDASYLDRERSAELRSDRYVFRPAAARLDHDERSLHEEALSLALQPTSLEVFAHCSHAAGVATHMPFYDRELVELSVSLPSHWKLRDGQSRYILREAFRHSLPPDLLARRDKFDFGPAFLHGLVNVREKVMDLTQPCQPHLSGLVNRPLLADVRERMARNGTRIHITDAFFLWRVAMLTLWNGIAASIDPVVGPQQSRGS